MEIVGHYSGVLCQSFRKDISGFRLGINVFIKSVFAFLEVLWCDAVALFVHFE